MKIAASIVVLGTVIACAGIGAAQAAEPFSIASSAFADNGALETRNAGNDSRNPNCVGQNVSPSLSWSNAPAGTTSFALLIYDPDGRLGLGVSHQVAYGIPASITSFPEGGLGDQGQNFVRGKSTPGAAAYYGPCPPAGTGRHHFLFTIIATDLAPDALPAGLTRDELLAKLDGHAKGDATIVGRFGR